MFELRSEELKVDNIHFILMQMSQFEVYGEL